MRSGRRRLKCKIAEISPLDLPKLRPGKSESRISTQMESLQPVKPRFGLYRVGDKTIDVARRDPRRKRPRAAAQESLRRPDLSDRQPRPCGDEAGVVSLGLGGNGGERG